MKFFRRKPPRAIVVGAVMVAIVAAAFLAAYLRGMPGRFIYGDSGYLVELNWRGKHNVRWEQDYRPDSGEGIAYNGPRTALSLSPDKKRLAYLYVDSGIILRIVVVGIFDAGADPSEVAKSAGISDSQKWLTQAGQEKLDFMFDVKRLGIPYCILSNLEWSPDGKCLAYATSDRLYIASIASGDITSTAIPTDRRITTVETEWRKYYREPQAVEWLLSHKGGVPSSRQGVPAPVQGTQDVVSSGAQNAMAAVEAKEEDAAGKDRLPTSVTDIARRSRMTLKGFFGSDLTTWPMNASIWQELYLSSLDIAGGRDVVMKSYKYAGRSIRWCTENTILCDNLELSLLRNIPGKLKLEAAVLPVPCTYDLRPIWSYAGDKAAYLLLRPDKHLPDWYGKGRPFLPTEVVIVDKTGRILGHHLMEAWAEKLQWSRDGRYFATHAYIDRTGKHNILEICDTESSRHWRKCLGTDVDELAGDHPGWIWDY